ncbi:MAG: DUF342 domain-containing protein [Gammaproteobacteria bacterium]|nr:DUF342 domain-containing protein [Gammaproteobacteria bacterium]
MSEPDKATELDHHILLLGSLAHRLNMISTEQFNKAIEIFTARQAQQPDLRFGQVLIDLKMISLTQIRTLIQHQKLVHNRKLDIRFGKLAVANHFTDAETVEAALKYQTSCFRERQEIILIGDILTNSGVLTPQQRDTLLKAQGRLAADGAIKKVGGPLESDAIEVPEPIASYIIGVSNDRFNATFRLKSHDITSETLPDLAALLKEYGIIYGVISQSEFIELINHRGEEEFEWVVAQGRPPEPGQDANITYHFNTDPLEIGRVLEDGIIDFRERGEIPILPEETLLAELNPPIEGKSGIDVYGNTVPPPPPKNIKIRVGEGVKLSEDGCKAYAAQSGTPTIMLSGALHMLNIWAINGNVDYKSGNIHYNGEIRVTGSVYDGFKVQGKRLIASEIGKATIDIEDDVVVLGGIIGAKMRIGGNLKANYIHNADIEVAGEVIIMKEVMGSTIHSVGSIYARNCTIFSSTLTSCNHIESKNVGNDARTSPATLGIGTCQYINKRIHQIQGELAPLTFDSELIQEELELLQQQMIDNLSKQEKDLHAKELFEEQLRRLTTQMTNAPSQQRVQIKSQLHVTKQKLKAVAKLLGSLEAEQKKITQERETLKGKLEQLQQQAAPFNHKLRQLEEQKLELFSQEANLYIFGALYPLNQLELRHSRMRTQNSLKSVKIFEEQQQNELGNPTWFIKQEPLGKHNRPRKHKETKS